MKIVLMVDIIMIAKLTVNNITKMVDYNDKRIDNIGNMKMIFNNESKQKNEIIVALITMIRRITITKETKNKNDIN